MSDQNTIRPLSDEELASVSGGTTKDYRAAVDLMNGVYGSGADAQKAIGDLYKRRLITIEEDGNGIRLA